MSEQENDRIIATNPAFSLLTGYSPEDAWGKNPRFLSAGKTPQETYQRMWNEILDSGYWQGELWDRRKTGEPYPKWMTITVMRDQAGRAFIAWHAASECGNLVAVGGLLIYLWRVSRSGEHARFGTLNLDKVRG